MNKKMLLYAPALVLVGCVAQPTGTGAPRADLPRVAAQTTARAFALGAACDGRFAAHDLPHQTKARGGDLGVYDSNGAGLAVADFDHDGLLDVVLGNLDGPSHVLWNKGGFGFETLGLKTTLGLPQNGVRSVAAVDVNGDGWEDIAITTTQGGVSVYDNNQKRGFVQRSLPGVDIAAYSMLWADFDKDNDLDVVTASYNALLEAEQKDTFLLSRGAGVMAYSNNNGTFKGTKLKGAAQSLALAFFDANFDGERDLIVGNDFGMPDWAFSQNNSAQKDTAQKNNAWLEIKPFARITKNTMGFSVADTDLDGGLELFATDMKPSFKSRATLAKWMPFMQTNFERSQYKNVQRAENVLLKPKGMAYENRAYQMGLDATGWSWSSQFGDLDRNGYEDLYVVNGMIDKVHLRHLPNNELVEENLVFANTRGAFQARPDWGLASSRSGRSMALADFDNDGRLDIVVNNLESRAQIFENRLCGGNSIRVRPRLPGTSNSNAIGTTLRLYTSLGVMQREVQSQSGYLSGTPAEAHFAWPENAQITALEVIWPDGRQSILDKPKANTEYTLARTKGQP